ncbi:hypothetical protein Q5752_000923 [Cryptotrichosporon argae]
MSTAGLPLPSPPLTAPLPPSPPLSPISLSPSTPHILALPLSRSGTPPPVDPASIPLPPTPARHLAGRGPPPPPRPRAVSGRPDGWVSTVSPGPDADPERGRRVSGAMSWAFRPDDAAPPPAMRAQTSGTNDARVCPAAQETPDGAQDDGGTPPPHADLSMDMEDDEWVAFVKHQLAVLFPDLHAPEDAAVADIHADVAAHVAEYAPDGADADGREPTFRAELVALREEIARLRGVVGGLAAGIEEVVEGTPALEDEGDTGVVVHVGPPAIDAVPSPELDTPSSTDEPCNPPAAFFATADASAALIRALDARVHQRTATDEEVFAVSNLDALLARVRSGDL